MHMHASARWISAGRSRRPEASYIVERLIDNAAREMQIDRAELRRRNTVPASAMPFKTGLVYTLDWGEFGENLDCCDGADSRDKDAYFRRK
jgi:aerobic carbon-monoxide dehydrogenase large subunit